MCLLAKRYRHLHSYLYCKHSGQSLSPSLYTIELYFYSIWTIDNNGSLWYRQHCWQVSSTPLTNQNACKINNYANACYWYVAANAYGGATRCGGRQWTPLWRWGRGLRVTSGAVAASRVAGTPPPPGHAQTGCPAESSSGSVCPAPVAEPCSASPAEWRTWDSHDLKDRLVCDSNHVLNLYLILVVLFRTTLPIVLYIFFTFKVVLFYSSHISTDACVISYTIMYISDWHRDQSRLYWHWNQSWLHWINPDCIGIDINYDSHWE